MIPTFNNTPMRTELTRQGKGGVIKVFYECCEEPVFFAVYKRVDNDYVITSYAKHPRVTEENCTPISEELVFVLTQEAAYNGVKNLFIIEPGKKYVTLVSCFEPKPLFAMGVEPYNTPSQYLN